MASEPEIQTPYEVAYRLMAEANPYGAFHIVVDDGNMDDENIAFCLGNPECTDHDRELADALLRLKVDDRDDIWERLNRPHAYAALSPAAGNGE